MRSDEQLVHIPHDAAPLAASRQPEGFQLRKWGGAAKAGYQLVPNVLFRAQKKLGLDAVDVVILLNLSLHWWSPTNLPFPPPAAIANRMGLSRRTVERRIKNLEKKELIRRTPSQVEGVPQRRRYELGGLVERLGVAASDGLFLRDLEKRRRVAEKEQRSGRVSTYDE